MNNAMLLQRKKFGLVYPISPRKPSRPCSSVEGLIIKIDLTFYYIYKELARTQT